MLSKYENQSKSNLRSDTKMGKKIHIIVSFVEIKLSHSFSFALKIGKFLLWPKTMATEVSHLL